MKSFLKGWPALLIQTHALIFFGVWIYCSLIKGEKAEAETGDESSDGRPFRFNGKFSLIIAAALFAAGTLSASGRNAGTGSADFLRITPDSRSAAFGNSGVADVQSGFAIANNPSLLSQSSDKVRIAGSRNQWIDGVEGAHYAASLVMPGRAWAVGAYMTDWKSAAFAATDRAGRSNGTLAYKAQSLSVGAAHAMSDSLSVGFAAKQISQSFTQAGGANAGRDAAKAVLYDAGASYKMSGLNMTLGAAVQNLGQKVSFGNQQEAVSRVVRLGLEGDVMQKQVHWMLEGSHEAGAASFRTGVGYSPFPMMSLRAGYDANLAQPNLVGLTTGLGLQWKNTSFDYAFVPFGDLGVTQRMSMTWKWGNAATAAPRINYSAPKPQKAVEQNSNGRHPRMTRPAPRGTPAPLSGWVVQP